MAVPLASLAFTTSRADHRHNNRTLHSSSPGVGDAKRLRYTVLLVQQYCSYILPGTYISYLVRTWYLPGIMYGGM